MEDDIRSQISEVEKTLSQDSRGQTLARQRKTGTGKKAPVLDEEATVAQLKDAAKQKKAIQQDMRKRALEEMNRSGDKGVQAIVMPEYELDKRLKVMREVRPPPEAAFIGLGYDDDDTTKRKHYRTYYPDELENNKDIFPKPSPFDSFELKRGAARGPSGGGLFSFKKKKENKTKVETTGYFKGIVQIESYPDRDAYRANKKMIIDDLKKNINELSKIVLKKEMIIDVDKLASAAEREKFETNIRKLHIDHLNISRHLVNLESDTILKRMIQNESKQVIRLYIVEAFGLSSRDNGSASDPYLQLHCNGQSFNDRDNYKLDEINPVFCKRVDFEGMFPGSAPVKI